MAHQVYTPNNADAARSILNSEARQHTCVVYFQKADGTRRRMVCRYQGHTSVRPHLITVWDLEKGALRTINLRTVDLVKVLAAPQQPAPAPQPAPDREAKRRAFEALKAELADFC